MAEVEIGKVTEFFARPVVAGIQLTGELKQNELLRIKGHTTNIEVVAESIQIDHIDVAEGKPGDSIGIKVPDRVRAGDTVYRVIP
jgi:translation elongation factor EF-1alpha